MEVLLFKSSIESVRDEVSAARKSLTLKSLKRVLQLGLLEVEFKSKLLKTGLHSNRLHFREWVLISMEAKFEALHV